LGLLQVDVARKLFCDASLISKWEANRDVPRASQISLDTAYGAGGCLGDLLLAIGTPKTLPARHRWYHNFGPSGGPVWAWIRSMTPGGSEGRITWGPYGFTIAVPGGPAGMIINAPVSVNNPPTLVQLEQPGWVDFGRGNVPDWVSAPVVDGAQLLDVSDQGKNETIGLIADHMRGLLDVHGRTQGELAAFLRQRPELVAEVLGRVRQRAAVERLAPTPRLEAVVDPARGARLCAIRRGRGIFQREVAGLLTTQEGTDGLPPITSYHIRVIEDSGISKVDFLVERLDILYRCDGLLTCSPIGPLRAGVGEARFPDFWVGNVWLDIEPAEGQRTDVELLWGGYRRPLSLEGRTAVTLRKSLAGQPPLLVKTCEDCRWQAGVGFRPDAVDVNQNWQHEATRGAQVVEELLDAVLALASRTRAEFDAFLGLQCRPEVQLGTA
jgi:hypothetical protein